MGALRNAERSPAPLRYRLPNPPRIFVGRRREAAWLSTAIARAPVVIVSGAGGIGKTALVLHTLAAAGRDDGAILVRLLPSHGSAPLGLELVRALAEARRCPIEWSALQGDAEATTQALLELAEAARAAIVLDDLHHADPAEVRGLLVELTRHARDSRIVAVSRTPVAAPELAEAAMTLGPMSDAELAQLGRRQLRALANPAGRAGLDAAVARAGGSPWRLRQALASAVPEAATRPLLEALAVTELALPLDTVARFAPRPTPAAVADCERRGLVEAMPNGHRLHDLARELVGRPRATLVRRAARVLAGHDDLTLRAEAAALLAAEGAVAELARLIDGSGEAMLQAGHAARLCRALETTRAPALQRFRLRCAVELGSAAALDGFADPGPGGELADRLLWARAEVVRGRLGPAEHVLAEACARAERDGDPALGFEAGLLRARILLELGRADESPAVLGALAPPDDASRARQAALALLVRLRRDGPEPVRPHVADLQRLVERAAGPGTAQAAFWLAALLFALGRPSEAMTLVARPELDGLSLGNGPHAFWRRSGHAAIDDARALGARLDACNASLATYFKLGEVYRRRYAGELRGLDELLDQLRLDARRRGSAFFERYIETQVRHLKMLRGEPPPDAGAPWGPLPLTRVHELRQLQHRVRHGERPPPGWRLPGLRIERPEVRPVADMVAAQVRLLDGDGAGARDDARAAVADAAACGHAFREADARHLLCEILAALAAWDELAAAARPLGALAERLSSARFAAEAELFIELCAPRLPPVPLDELAGAAAVAPVAARRAQALLGGSPALDAVDRLILATAQRRAGWARLERPRAVADAMPGWGLDDERGEVWLPEGRIVRLRATPLLLRLLAALADAGGAASKEDLVLAVWGEREYHPLRHDNRLHVAVRKLRRVVEDRPAAPTRLVTTGDGYAIGAGFARIARG